jgi:uncharacterized protein (TIRG00374 family)
VPEAADHRGRRAAAIAIALACAGALFVIADGREVARVLAGTAWRPVPFALLFSAISYAALSLGFAWVCSLFGMNVPRRELVTLGFVSTALSNLVALGGVAGFSLRILVLRRRGLTAAEILGPSLFYGYLSNLMLVALLPAGLFVLLHRHPLSPRSETLILAAAGILGLLALLGALFLVQRSIRSAILGFVAAVTRRLSGRRLPSALQELDENLSQGIVAASERPRALIAPVLSVFVDWGACLAAMACCFLAFGTSVRADILVTGFTVGIAAGLISMVPGGLGVQEGSMSGVYALLGVPFETALLAAVLFRVVYYFVPYLASLALYRRLLRGQ